MLSSETKTSARIECQRTVTARSVHTQEDDHGCDEHWAAESRPEIEEGTAWSRAGCPRFGLSPWSRAADIKSGSSRLTDDLLEREGILDGGPVSPKLDENKTSESGAGEPALDTVDLLERLNGDRALLVELVEIFKSETPRALHDIRQLVLTSNASGLERAAHTLRGTVMAFGAGRAARAAQEVESLARSGALAGVEHHVRSLEREIDHLTVALDRLIESRDCENPDCRR
jgi:HPt (histidine-containing phosphotransfer) domain-containing protein